MNYLTARIAIIAAATLIAACAPADTTGVSKRDSERSNVREIYMGDVLLYRITEFENSIGEHCTAISKYDGQALHCIPKAREVASPAPIIAPQFSSDGSSSFVLESSRP